MRFVRLTLNSKRSPTGVGKTVCQALQHGQGGPAEHAGVAQVQAGAQQGAVHAARGRSLQVPLLGGQDALGDQLHTTLCVSQGFIMLWLKTLVACAECHQGFQP